LKDKRIVIGLIIIFLVVSSVLIIIFLPREQEPEVINETPQIILNSPEPSSTVSGIIPINIEIIDEENLTADIYIDGLKKATANMYNWNTSVHPDGKHTIRARVKDSGGLRDSASMEVRVENVEEIPKPFSGLFKVMVYNIKESGENDDWKIIVKEENPDILVLVETGLFDDNSNERFNRYVSEFNRYFANESPYDAYCSQWVYYPTTGEAILSRFPILSFRQISSVPLDDGSDYDVTHDFIYAVVDINGTNVHVFGGHLKASEGENNPWRREREMEGLINYMDDLGDVPILYLSDQNSFSPFDIGPLSPSGMDLGYGPMTMMLVPDDPIYGNYSSTMHNFIDVFRRLNPLDPGYTFGHQVFNTSIRIDYIIVNQFFKYKLLNSTVISSSPSDSASDHYAVTAFIQWNLSSSFTLESFSNYNHEKISYQSLSVILNLITQPQKLVLNLQVLVHHQLHVNHRLVREELLVSAFLQPS
jgi:endonuclease/exonuclease/phosphatase family metal-dependent hydrolase